MTKQPRLNYIVQLTLPTNEQIHYTALGCSSKQAACRRAFKYWHAVGFLKTQPKTSPDSDSSFENVKVETF